MRTRYPTNRLARVLPATLAEVDSLFDQFLAGSVPSPTRWRAPATFWEEDNKLFVELDVPGVKLEDVAITFDKGRLEISVERKAPEGERKSWTNERTYGKVTRTLALPETADPEAIEASLSEGVLRVVIGKHPEAQPKRIDVRAN